MIVGIGTDICSIARIRKAAEQESFRKRVFTEAELLHAAHGGKHEAASLAAAYAAKEAFAKALGTGVRGFELREVGVEHDTKGTPFYKLTGKALAVSESRRISAWHLSLSHDGAYAVAYAVAESGTAAKAKGGVIKL